MVAIRRRLIFHLQYHLNDPPAATIQRVVEDYLFGPKYGLSLNQLTDSEGDEIPINGTIFVYSRVPSIGTCLSYIKPTKVRHQKCHNFYDQTLLGFVVYSIFT